MNEPHELRTRARPWLRRAHEDLALALDDLDREGLVARGPCVWAHQAAEKALKALLIDGDIDPPKSHNLVRLNEMLPVAVAVEHSDLVELSRWSIEGRYPADLDEATTADAHAAVETACRVVAAAAERLPTDVEGGR